MSLPAATVYPSRFLKADRRAVTETAGSRVHRTAFEAQACFDDVFIRPGQVLRPEVAGRTGQLLVLPIVGGALLVTAPAAEVALLPGCLYSVPAAEARACTLSNPFDHETVNLLLLWVSVPAAGAGVREWELPLTVKNELVAPADPTLPVRVGLYDSRVKGRIAVVSPAGYVLCYVLNGSFEVEERLAEHRDALVLWDTPAVEFEALSELAMLLYVEFARS